MMEGWSGMWGFGWIYMLFFWALIILAVAALARWLFAGADSTSRRALEILQERYARGEIDADQYAQMRRKVES